MSRELKRGNWRSAAGFNASQRPSLRHQSGLLERFFDGGLTNLRSLRESLPSAGGYGGKEDTGGDAKSVDGEVLVLLTVSFDEMVRQVKASGLDVLGRVLVKVWGTFLNTVHRAMAISESERLLLQGRMDSMQGELEAMEDEHQRDLAKRARRGHLSSIMVRAAGKAVQIHRAEKDVKAKADADEVRKEISARAAEVAAAEAAMRGSAGRGSAGGMVEEADLVDMFEDADGAERLLALQTLDKEERMDLVTSWLHADMGALDTVHLAAELAGEVVKFLSAEEMAAFLANMSSEDRRRLLRAVSPDELSVLVEELLREHPEVLDVLAPTVLGQMDPEQLSMFMAGLKGDRIKDMLQSLTLEQRMALLKAWISEDKMQDVAHLFAAAEGAVLGNETGQGGRRPSSHAAHLLQGGGMGALLAAEKEEATAVAADVDRDAEAGAGGGGTKERNLEKRVSFQGERGEDEGATKTQTPVALHRLEKNKAHGGRYIMQREGSETLLALLNTMSKNEQQSMLEHMSKLHPRHLEGKDGYTYGNVTVHMKEGALCDECSNVIGGDAKPKPFAKWSDRLIECVNVTTQTDHALIAAIGADDKKHNVAAGGAMGAGNPNRVQGAVSFMQRKKDTRVTGMTEMMWIQYRKPNNKKVGHRRSGIWKIAAAILSMRTLAEIAQRADNLGSGKVEEFQVEMPGFVRDYCEF